MAELPVSYLKFAVPTVPWRCSYLSLLAALVLLVAFALSLSTLYFHRRFLRPTIVMARKKIPGDELSVRAKENAYQRVHTETKTASTLYELYASTGAASHSSGPNMSSVTIPNIIFCYLLMRPLLSSTRKIR